MSQCPHLKYGDDCIKNSWDFFRGCTVMYGTQKSQLQFKHLLKPEPHLAIEFSLSFDKANESFSTTPITKVSAYHSKNVKREGGEEGRGRKEGGMKAGGL